MTESNVYIENGYKNRKDYLESLAADYGISKSKVFSLASFLGKDEDFDGLVTHVENLADKEWD